MVFQWKIPLKVPVEVAAAELDRIFDQYGEISPETVVDESRSEDAVLHPLFEWDDAKAAEKYRITQARFIIRNIEHESATENGPVVVRSYSQAEHNYAPTKTILADIDLRNLLLERALKEFEEYRAKYHSLAVLATVFEAMDEIKKST